MDAELWRQAGDIIVGALELEGSERDRYLERETTGNPELLAEVQQHLDSYAKAGSAFLAEPLFHAPSTTLPDGALGRKIGPYVLKQPLGYGGMGAVYLAGRADGAFDRDVAIKLISLGLNHQEVVRSLEQERQILARLDHPNIAKLLDAGATDEGWPYFVMDYIEGAPIDRYCRQHRLTVDQRVALIRQVCSAVQYAHQNLVIHRDLKPGNILVDTNGVPHLLDFGIAKIFRPGLVPTVTARGQRPMTLEYASPEQSRYDPISSASDVYSLGLVLYELLIGRRAYRFDGCSPAEIERLICEQELPPPSVAVTAAPVEGEEGTDASTFRERDSRRLSHRLKGDLDTIVLMALRKEPQRRFGSVEQLADDLRRAQSGLPVSAQTDTFSYRTSKFLGRHRLAVATTAFVILLMSAFIASLLVQRREIIQQRDAAQRLSEDLTLERDSAEEVKNFLLRLFQGADPKDGKRYEMTALQLLDEGSSKVADLDVKPLVKANLMASIGNSYLGMGLYAKARELYIQGRDLRRSVLGEGHLEVGEFIHQIAATYEKEGRYEDADSMFHQALTIFEKEAGPEDIRVAFCLDYIAAVYLSQERYAEAEPYFLRAHAITEKLYGKEHSRIASGLNNIAALYRTTGRYSESESLQKESIEIATRVLGREHPFLALAENNLAVLYREQGRFLEAEPLSKKALEVRLRELGPEHPNVINSQMNLATLYRAEGRYEEAEPLYLQALDTCDRTLNDDHPYVAQAQNGLAQVYTAQGRFDEARSLFESALEIRRRILGPRHSKVAEVLRGQADLYRALGESSKAEALYRQAMEIQQEKLGPQHPRVAPTLEGYAALLRDSGRAAEAEPLEQQAARIRSQIANAG